MRGACLAPLLLAACTFSAPEGTGAPDDDPGAGNNGGGSGNPQCRDSDGDGVCNEVDDWPCGVKPASPQDPMGGTDLGTGRAWQGKNAAIGDIRRIVVAPGADFHAVFDWTLWVYCGNQVPMCKGQIEIGYDDTRTACLFDGDAPSVPGEKPGHFDAQLRAPSTPGIYHFRINGGRRTSCGTSGWFGGTPGDKSTFAIVCVPPPAS